MELRNIPIGQAVDDFIFDAGFAIRLEQANAVLVDCCGNGKVKHGSSYGVIMKKTKTKA
jgi:hypothetical protein